MNTATTWEQNTYDVNVKIKEGIAIVKRATSLRAKRLAKQAVEIAMPSNGEKIPQSGGVVKSKIPNNKFWVHRFEAISKKHPTANILSQSGLCLIDQFIVKLPSILCSFLLVSF